MHTRYRSFVGRLNWLQRRTQFQCCYKFSRCASKAASPTIGDVKALDKLARQLKSQPVKLQFWPLTDRWDVLDFLVPPTRNNEDWSSQRGMTVFFYQNCVSIPRRMECHMEVLLTTKGKRSREPYSQQPWQNCIHSWKFGSCQFLSGLWMDLSSQVADIHMRTDAKNLVTTARTIHLPEQNGNNPHDFHVVKGSLFREYSWSCSHYNSELFGRLFDKVIGEGWQFDHNSKNMEIIGSWRSSKLQDTHGA